MELLIYIGLELIGVVILVSTLYLAFGKKKPKTIQSSKAEQIAAETARLETENKRLEREYETLRDEKFEALGACDEACSCTKCQRPLIGPKTLAAIEAKGKQFEADCRAARIKAEFAYYRSKGELPENSLLDSRMLAQLTSYYESQISSAFAVAPMILTDGTRIEFRKLN